MDTSFDIDRLRAETPGIETGRMHLNHAGASPVSAATLAAVTDHMLREGREGPMEAAASVEPAVGRARAALAALLGAEASEIAVAGSGSTAWGLAFAALPPLHAGDRMLVGRHEWGSNLSTMQLAAARAGASIEVIPSREDGAVDADALAAMLDERVRLVSLTWLPANGGLINDAAAVGAVARAAGVPYFLDAGQAVGQVPVDVAAIGCDVLAAAGRKYLRGPRGTAFAYVRQGFLCRLEPAFVDVPAAPWYDGAYRLRPDARRIETSGMPTALLLGLGEAARQALDLGVEPIRERIASLSAALRDGLAGIPGVTVRDLGAEHSGLVSFTVDGIAAGAVKDALAEQGITIGANGVPYTPLDMAARNLGEIARASVSYLNTADEIDRLCAAVAGVARAAAEGRPRSSTLSRRTG